MRKFDTKVQLLKYKVLREVARIAFDEGEFSLANNFNDIAKTVTSDKATMRCCIYKERAIVAERIKLACGGNRANPNIIETVVSVPRFVRTAQFQTIQDRVKRRAK